MINYKPKICKKCKKEFIPNANSQIYCKECTSEVIKSQKRKWKKNHREMINAQKKRHYTKYIERERARDKINYLKNPEKAKNKVMQWRKNNPHRFYLLQKKYINERKRQFGFIPLNGFFEGSVAHHIDKERVIFMPKEIHQKIKHSVLKNYNMDEINAIAFNYLDF